jgi:hypothetical protein
VESDLQIEIHLQECYLTKAKFLKCCPRNNRQVYVPSDFCRSAGHLLAAFWYRRTISRFDRNFESAHASSPLMGSKSAIRERGSGVMPERGRSHSSATMPNSGIFVKKRKPDGVARSGRKMPPCPPPRTLTGRGYHPEAI